MQYFGPFYWSVRTALQRSHIYGEFIFLGDLYSTTSRELLRGAPDSSTAKKNSFQVSIERVRERSGKQAQFQGQPIPDRQTEKKRFCMVAVLATEL